ncbi:unnamed protein product [Cyclocybe aegerita]|uniref:Exonuclease V n=1 Tax=Cyclocybe aegerita TaxID=1973307 RepID=A0A8S0WSZ6_CYCAE|nr:unnamed protein product [Cyclocybe aegerita]
MATQGSDSFSDFDFSFSEFTEQDLAKLDAAIKPLVEPRPIPDEPPAVADASFQSEICGLNLNVLTEEELAKLDAATEEPVILEVREADALTDASFQSDVGGINFNTMSAEDLARLDEAVPQNAAGGPAIQIQLEEERPSAADDQVSGAPPTTKSPYQEFRAWNHHFSVTDLVSPAWCEAQYDYGLRGRRSRPTDQRPKSFTSASGKTIKVEQKLSESNYIATKQGLAVHRELEREMNFNELEIEIETEESMWALRLFNMIACFQSISGGIVREVPVLGIIHNEVVVGIVDEIIKVEATSHEPKNKRVSETSPNHSSKRARHDPPSSQMRIEPFFPSPKKSNTPSTHNGPRYGLYIKDNKTRAKRKIPLDQDTLSGRLQLMIYRRLLSQLLSTDPPYDFNPIWKKLELDPEEVFPTKFLVQSRLIESNDGFKTACLNDLVDMWHRQVKEADLAGVSMQLELVYRLRPSHDEKGKGKQVASSESTRSINQEEEDLARAIAASLEDACAAEVPVAGPSIRDGATIETLAAASGLVGQSSDKEDRDLQRALEQSLLEQSGASGVETPVDGGSTPTVSSKDKGKAKEQPSEPEPEGMMRFPIIGTKAFFHNDAMLDAHLDHVLKWWHGERKPEGVPVEYTYRCRWCEYANDCEWRAEKALEISQKAKERKNSRT